jgi:hypothetical protein
MPYSDMKASKWCTSDSRTFADKCRSLSHDQKAGGWVSEPPRVLTREQVLARVDLAWNSPIRTPSHEVVNVAVGLSGPA